MSRKKYPEVPESALKGQVRTNLDSPEPTQSQLDRKNKYTKMVASLGVPILDGLPVVEDENNVIPRSTEDIAKRAIAVATAAVKGEGLAHEEVIGLINAWDVKGFFSPEELAFVNDKNPSERDRIKFAWRYECLDVLLWALGYKKKLPPPNSICDVKTDVTIVRENRRDLLWKNAKPRNINELLDMADFYYRLHWGAIELRLKGKDNENINEEIIMERHYALNWLIRYMGKAWDDVTTDT